MTRSRWNPMFWLELLAVVAGTAYGLVESLFGKLEDESEPCKQHDIFRRGGE